MLVDLRKCGVTDTENCLKAVTLNLNSGDMVRTGALTTIKLWAASDTGREAYGVVTSQSKERPPLPL